MLSNLILPAQKFILIIDEVNHEELAHNTIGKLLEEQGQDSSTFKILELSSALKDPSKFDAFIRECSDGEEDRWWNVLMPPLSDLCCYQPPTVLFQFIHELKESRFVGHIFLWASLYHLPEAGRDFLLACFEYMSDTVLHLQSPTELAVMTRKPGGSVTNKTYTYKRTKNEFLLEPLMDNVFITQQTIETSKAQAGPAAETFKIELEEDELVARNALTMPYEKTGENNTPADIIYTPDAQDDFDDEDPDEDLCI